jgi:hypothetical protein
MARRLLVATGLVVLFAGLSLTPPPPDPQRRWDYLTSWVPLVDSLGFPYTIDAAQFIALARRPGRLLETRNPRQSRPLYVLTGYALASLIHPLLPATPGPMVTDPTYVAFVAFNFGVLIAAVALWDALFTGRRWAFAVVPTAVLLVANDLVRDHLWMPHTQMFNVLVPVLSMALFTWAARHPAVAAPRLAPIGLLVGILFLYYGSAVLLGASIAAGLAAGRRRRGDARTSLVGQLAGLALGFAVVPVAWWVTVVVLAGDFYSDETARFRQFVWLLDAWRSDRPLSIVAQRLSVFARVVAQVAWFPATLCAAAGAVAFLAGVDRRRLAGDGGSLLAAAGVTLGLVLLFFGALGWYNELLEWNVVPPLLAVTAVLLTAARERMSRTTRVALAVAVVAATVGWLGHEVCEPRGDVTRGSGGVRSPVCDAFAAR